jgi:hypothetical protein
MLGVPPQSGDLFRRWIHEFFELGITDQYVIERAVADQSEARVRSRGALIAL